MKLGFEARQPVFCQTHEILLYAFFKIFIYLFYLILKAESHYIEQVALKLTDTGLPLHQHTLCDIYFLNLNVWLWLGLEPH